MDEPTNKNIKKTELRGQVIKRPFLLKEECPLKRVTARERATPDKTRELNKSLLCAAAVATKS